MHKTGAIPPVEVSLMGGGGGCMLGGSEDDLCRPVRSKGLGFQVLDAEPPGPDNWTGDEMGKKEMGVIKMKKKGD